MSNKYKLEVEGESWQRKEWTTRCRDPTVIVEWSRPADGLTITEFQGVYVVDDIHAKQPYDFEAAHVELERMYSEAMEAEWTTDDDVDDVHPDDGPAEFSNYQE